MNYEQLIITNITFQRSCFSSLHLLKWKKKKLLCAFSMQTEFLLVNQEDLTYQLPYRELNHVFD